MFELTEYIAVDTETNSLNTQTGQPFCATMCNMLGETMYVELRDDYTHLDLVAWTDDELLLKRVLEGWGCTPVFHNAKFDIKMLENVGFPRLEKYEDTMLMAFLLDEYSRVGMDYLAQYHLGESKYADPAVKEWLRTHKDDLKKNGYLNMPRNILEPYALHDTEITLKLFFCFKGEMDRRGDDVWGTYSFEKEFLLTLIETERQGIYVDVPYGLAKLRDWFKRECDSEHTLKGLGVENPRSPFQVRDAFFQLGVPLDGTNKKTLLRVIANESNSKKVRKLAGDILTYRRVANLTSKVLIPILRSVTVEGSRIHTSFKQCTAVTGRLASEAPNIQNLHRPDPRIETSLVPRNLFGPTPDWYLEGYDYDQMEMRGVANVTCDPALTRFFDEGGDPYLKVAAWIWPGQDITKRMRFLAKQSTLGASFGMGARTFVEQSAGYGVYVSLDEAYHVLQLIHEAFPFIKDKLKELAHTVVHKGFVVDIFGKHYHVPAEFSYKALNAIVQGTAAQVMKRAWMQLVKQQRVTLWRMLNCMHDEVLIERHKTCGKLWVRHLIKTAMESQNHRFRIPLTASVKEYTGSWATGV